MRRRLRGGRRNPQWKRRESKSKSHLPFSTLILTFSRWAESYGVPRLKSCVEELFKQGDMRVLCILGYRDSIGQLTIVEWVPISSTVGIQLIKVYRESTKPQYAKKKADKAIKFHKLCMSAFQDWLETELPMGKSYFIHDLCIVK